MSHIRNEQYANSYGLASLGTAVCRLLRVVTTPIEFGPYLRQSVAICEVVDADIARAAEYLSNVRVTMFQNTEGKKTGWGGTYSGESVSIICDDPV